jgi:hypothetical protein
MSVDHRLADRLITYWNGLRKDAPLPDFGHFNASSIADIWQQCVLFTVSPAVENKPFVLNFYQVGDKIKPIYGNDMIGRSFNTAQRHFQGAAIVRRMEETIESPSVLTDVGQFINERSKVVKYRSCLLPFGRDGKVTHVVVGLSWREY